MTSADPTFKTVSLLSLGLSALVVSSCTTSNSLVSTSAPAAAVRMDGGEIEQTQVVSSPTTNESATAVGNDPAALRDPVAIERPVETLPSKPPITLTTVPRTEVAHQPPGRIMMVRTTAYSHLEPDSLPYGQLTAAGTRLKFGSNVRSAAADWSKFPVGTRFKIEGLPYEYIVDDYGSALCGTETIDLYKPNMAGIGRWGVRNIPIQIVEWGSFEQSRKILASRTHVKKAWHVRKMLSDIEKMTPECHAAASGGTELPL